MKAIMAMAKNRAIGKDGKMPWHLPEDFKWFREITLGKTIVIGRKTYEKLPILKNREIYVLSNTLPVSAGALVGEGAIYHHINSNFFYNIPSDAIIAGGKSIYELFMPQITEFYVTHIDKAYDGDSFMSPFEHLFKYSGVMRGFTGAKVIKYWN